MELAALEKISCDNINLSRATSHTEGSKYAKCQMIQKTVLLMRGCRGVHGELEYTYTIKMRIERPNIAYKFCNLQCTTNLKFKYFRKPLANLHTYWAWFFCVCAQLYFGISNFEDRVLTTFTAILHLVINGTFINGTFSVSSPWLTVSSEWAEVRYSASSSAFGTLSDTW